LAVRIFPQISTRADEVPIELQGCGFNQEEIVAINLDGHFSGCSSVPDGARMAFPDLKVEFSTDGARCGAVHGRLDHRPVFLHNVVYTASMRPGPPPCIVSSTVTFDRDFDSRDPAIANLFAAQGVRTLTPILDRYALGWANDALRHCPPEPVFVGVRSRCS
jgi:hypothetical protein